MAGARVFVCTISKLWSRQGCSHLLTTRNPGISVNLNRFLSNKNHPQYLRKEDPSQTANKFVPEIGDPNKNPFNPSLFPEEVRYGDPLEGLGPEERTVANEILIKVNAQIAGKEHGRLFAIIHMGGHQFRVTDQDIVMLLGTYHVAVGEKIKLEKVLAVGSADFTLLGRPILDRDFVNVDATVIEKTLSYPEIYFRHIKPMARRQTKFGRYPLTMVRINRITFKRCLNERPNPDEVVHNLG